MRRGTIPGRDASHRVVRTRSTASLTSSQQRSFNRRRAEGRTRMPRRSHRRSLGRSSGSGIEVGRSGMRPYRAKSILRWRRGPGRGGTFVVWIAYPNNPVLSVNPV